MILKLQKLLLRQDNQVAVVIIQHPHVEIEQAVVLWLRYHFGELSQHYKVSVYSRADMG